MQISILKNSCFISVCWTESMPVIISCNTGLTVVVTVQRIIRWRNINMRRRLTTVRLTEKSNNKICSGVCKLKASNMKFITSFQLTE